MSTETADQYVLHKRAELRLKIAELDQQRETLIAELRQLGGEYKAPAPAIINFSETDRGRMFTALESSLRRDTERLNGTLDILKQVIQRP